MTSSSIIATFYPLTWRLFHREQSLQVRISAYCVGDPSLIQRMRALEKVFVSCHAVIFLGGSALSASLRNKKGERISVRTASKDFWLYKCVHTRRTHSPGEFETVLKANNGLLGHLIYCYLFPWLFACRLMYGRGPKLNVDGDELRCLTRLEKFQLAVLAIVAFSSYLHIPQCYAAREIL